MTTTTTTTTTTSTTTFDFSLTFHFSGNILGLGYILQCFDDAGWVR